MKFYWISAALALALAVPAASIAQAASDGQSVTSARDAASTRTVTGGACTDLSNVKFKTDDNPSSSTNSSAFGDISSGNVTFTQGGESAGCVIVTYSAESYAPYGRLLRIRARLDGSKVAEPGAVQFSGDDDENEDGGWSRSHSFAFVFPSVEPGEHTLNMQFRSATSGKRVYIGKQTIVVHHQ
jgi:hypothetical protein